MKQLRISMALAYRAMWLFAATVAVGALTFLVVWIHHAMIARPCALTRPAAQDATSCTADLWLFGATWSALLTTFLLLFALCMLAALGWSSVRRKRG